MIRTIAFRRHHRKRRTKNEYNKWMLIWNNHEIATDCGRRFRDIRTPCSCPACGNPRKWFNEKTRQEKKNIINMQEQVDEYRQLSYIKRSNN